MKHLFTSTDKARIALAALKGIDTTSQVASAHKAHPVQVGLWKQKLAKEAHTIFDSDHIREKHARELAKEVDELHRIIGARDAELEWLKKKVTA
jgi:transposase